MKIRVYNSSWSNVGNAWFAISCRNLLRSMYPDATVADGDDDIRCAFRPRWNFEKRNAFELLQSERADLHVLCGPILPPCEPTGAFGRKIKDIHEHDEQYCIISGSGTGMSKEQQRAVGEVLIATPPICNHKRYRDLRVA